MGIHAACGLWAQRVGGGECGASAGMRMEAGGSHTVRQTISNLPSNDEDDRDDGAEQVGVKEDAGGTAGTRRGTIAGEV